MPALLLVLSMTACGGSPAVDQGVCVKTPDGIYTAEIILEMSAK